MSKRAVAVREPDAGHELHKEIEAARVLLAHYRDILGDDEQAKADMVEGETNLHDAIRHGLSRMLELKTMREALGAAIKQMQARDSRFEQQEKHYRVAIQTALDIAGRKKMETEFATISRAAVPQSVVITDESEVPSEYWTRSEPRVSKTKLREALKAGTEVPGAELSNGGETLHVHWS